MKEPRSSIIGANQQARRSRLTSGLAAIEEKESWRFRDVNYSSNDERGSNSPKNSTPKKKNSKSFKDRAESNSSKTVFDGEDDNVIKFVDSLVNIHHFQFLHHQLKKLSITSLKIMARVMNGVISHLLHISVKNQRFLPVIMEILLLEVGVKVYYIQVPKKYYIFIC